MSKPFRLLLLAIPHAAAAATVTAQVPPLPVDPSNRGGPLSVFPIAVSLDSASRDSLFGAGTPEENYFKGPGNGSAAPSQWSGQEAVLNPNFTIAEIFDYLPQPQRDAVEIDAMAVPTLLPEFDDQGVPENPGTAWVGLAVSVSNLNAGTSGSMFALRNDARADIASFFFGGSNGIPDDLIETTQLEMTREDLGFATPVNVDAMDFSMGIMQSNPTSTTSPFVPNRREFYFSVSWQFADDFDDIDFARDPANNFNWAPPDAAAIYVSEWLETSSGGTTTYEWSEPRIHLSRDALGFLPRDEGGELEDIDALTMSNSNGSIIFSTQPEPGRNQLLVVHVAFGAILVLPLKDWSGNLVTDRLGIGIQDDVDAACHEDPEISPAQPNGCKVGTPGKSAFADVLPGFTPMSLAAARLEVLNPTTGAVDLHRFTFQLRGWGNFVPPPLPASPEYRVRVHVRQPGQSPPTEIGNVKRLASNLTREFTLDLPPGTGGQDWIFDIFVQDSSGEPVGYSWSTTFRN